MESAAPPLPSPSAFPALPLHPHPHPHSATESHTRPAPTSDDHTDTQEQQQQSTTLSYARASKSNLPPTTAPEGISLPPPHPHSQQQYNGNGNANKHPSKQRPQWARPEGSASEKPKPSSSAIHARNKNRQSNPAPSTTTTTTAAATTAKRPRTVPGMPASMLPAPVANKKAKHKSSSQQQQPQQPTNGGSDASMIPSVGKKRRQSLRKTLPPTASKLSALAASFDFVPRAGAPSLPAPPIPAVSTTGSEAQQQHDDDTTSFSNGTLVEDDHADRQQQQQKHLVDGKEEEGNVDRSSEAEEIPAAQNGKADDDAAIRETVASAGAQGDEFRSESLTTADARGAVEAIAGTEPGLQSASAKKPVSAGSAPEPERVEAHEAAVKKELVSAVEEAAAGSATQKEQRSLAGFLNEAFVAAADGGFAPLDLPVTTDSVSQEEEKGDAVVSSQQQQPEKVKVTTIPGAVDASPVADLSWREKKGWWSPNPDQYDDSTAARSASTTPPPAAPNPTAAGPAAVEPAQSQGISKDEILLRFPPWKPNNDNDNDREKKGDQTPVKEMVKPDEVKPLADFLPSAFVAQSASSSESETAASSPSEETVTSKEDAAGGEKKKKTSSQQQQQQSALSSFLSNSFSATGPPTPLEAPVTVTVGEDEDEDEVPLNAEAIVAEPPLSDILDVDAVEDGKVIVDHGEEEKEKTAASTTTKEEKKHGWWSPDYISPEQSAASATTSSDAHQTGTVLVGDKLVQETVGSAGAQGDEFRAESYSNADKAGVTQLEPTPAGAQSTTASTSSKQQQQEAEEQGDGAAVKEAVVEQAAEPERSRTPIGQFLDQAFSARRSPSESVQEEIETGGISGQTQTTSPSATTEASGSSSSATSTPRASAVSETAPTPSATSSSQATRRRRSSSSPSPPPSPRRTSSHGQDDHHHADDDDDQPSHPHKAADEAPSLTLAIASAWHTAPWSRKLWAVLASVAINVGLPFINGVMLGFGELFARNVLGVRLGWPLASSSASASQGSSPQRANTGSVGLRAAGAGANSNPNIGCEVPGHAGAKTATEAVVEGARELAE